MHMNNETKHLNEEQYHKLCDACDSVLIAPDTTIVRVAIPWLHVIREHPLTLSYYSDIFDYTNGIRVLIRKWLRDFRNVAGWVKQVGRTLFADGQFWFVSKKLAQNIDILFVSHLLNEAHAGQAADFYFGDLPDELVEQGYSVAIVLINHSGRQGVKLAHKWKECKVPRIILSDSIGYSEEAALHQRLKNESLRLINVAKKQTEYLNKRVYARASQEALSNGSLTTMRFSRQIGSLVAKLNPSAIVAIHEGHAWERVAFAAARSVDPNVLCIGYQHAAVFRLQHAIRRSLGWEYNPDCILTAGPVGKKQLEQDQRLKMIPISVLGSNRSFQSDKFELPITPSAHIRGNLNSRACLVIPEGIESECHRLFEFSLACARACPEIQFIWRLHPIVTFEILVSNNEKLRNLPANIVFSRESLEADIARCSWALYRGTTAIIQAVAAGVRPLYLQAKGEMTIDPLYELDDWRINIENILDLKLAIEIDKTHPSLGDDSRYIFAKQYCRDFYSPMSAGVIKDVISQKMKAELS